MDAPPSLLIVEGNAHMLALLQRFLARQQLMTAAATSLPEARSLIAQQYYPVVLTDLFWPQDSGRELLRYIRQTSPRTRVVVMTPFGSPALHQSLQQEGAYACIPKPFSLHRLWQLLQQALQAEERATT
ncbi:MAG: hypothetical protein KatS3mg131_2737 [Candidatus Tectimicrobiota bacterium]|nr:MAG: hypothetical protein KatS3mg131_2737 [Candidatus Tectomicrobia bacterium]